MSSAQFFSPTFVLFPRAALMDAEPVVYIVDDDDGVRDSLSVLMESVGLRSRTFDSANAFLKAAVSPDSGCVILDIRMPGMNGLDLLDHLSQTKTGNPVVIVTAEADDKARARAKRGGAVALLEKPFLENQLLDTVFEMLGRKPA